MIINILLVNDIIHILDFMYGVLIFFFRLASLLFNFFYALYS